MTDPQLKVKEEKGGLFIRSAQTSVPLGTAQQRTRQSCIIWYFFLLESHVLWVGLSPSLQAVYPDKAPLTLDSLVGSPEREAIVVEPGLKLQIRQRPVLEASRLGPAEIVDRKVELGLSDSGC